MPDAIVSKGESIEKAVAKGLESLGLPREEVDITVLYKPESRFFGLVTRSAEVKLTPKRSPGEIMRDPNGTVSVVGGELRYEPPDQDGQPPVIIVDKELVAYYNEEETSGRIELSDGIEPLRMAWPEDVQPAKDISLDISDDGLQCRLFLTRQPGVEHRLAEQPPSTTIQLRLEKKTLPPPEISHSEIEQRLQAARVCYGLHWDRLTPEVLQGQEVSIIIAQGDPPKEPVDGHIEYVFQERQANIDLESDRVDHFEARAVVSADQDTLLARRHNSQPGEPGKDVYGRSISPRRPKEAEWKTGEGVYLNADRTEAYAAVAGLPVIQNGQLKVLQVYELAGDADISTGNIHFNGEVLVRGSVMDRVNIKVREGGVQVGGLVSHAKIIADGDIHVAKNVVSSELTAGGMTVIYLQLLAYLHAINRQIDDLLKGFYIVQPQAETADGKLLKHLLELKFSGIPRQIEELQEYYKGVAKYMDSELQRLIALLGKRFRGRGPLDIKSITELDALREQLRYWESVLEDASRQHAHISAKYLQNSSLRASGMVEITGKGCYYSKVTAGQGFALQSGVFRGGSIVVDEGDIFAKEMGGPTGVATEARVVHEGMITSQRVYPNVTLAIQNEKFKFDHEASSVKAVWSEGTLQVFSGSVELT